MTFAVDSIVWAKMRGYPFWPSVITKDRTTGVIKKGSGSQAKLHITFLGGDWEPAWIPQFKVKIFHCEDAGPRRRKEYRVVTRWKSAHLAATKAALVKLKGGSGGTGLRESRRQTGPEIRNKPNLMTAAQKYRRSLINVDCVKRGYLPQIPPLRKKRINGEQTENSATNSPPQIPPLPKSALPQIPPRSKKKRVTREQTESALPKKKKITREQTDSATNSLPQIPPLRKKRMNSEQTERALPQILPLCKKRMNGDDTENTATNSLSQIPPLPKKRMNGNDTENTATNSLPQISPLPKKRMNGDETEITAKNFLPQIPPLRKKQMVNREQTESALPQIPPLRKKQRVNSEQTKNIATNALQVMAPRLNGNEKIPEAQDTDEVLEEIARPRNDFVIKITGFSITYTYPSQNIV